MFKSQKVIALLIASAAVLVSGCNDAATEATNQVEGMNVPSIEGMPELKFAGITRTALPSRTDAEKSAVRAGYQNTVTAPALERILGLWNLDCHSGGRAETSAKVVYSDCEVAVGTGRHYVTGTVTLSEGRSFPVRMDTELTISVYNQYGEQQSSRYMIAMTMLPSHPNDAVRIPNHHQHMLEVFEGDRWVSYREFMEPVSRYGFKGSIGVEMSDPELAPIIGFGAFGADYDASNGWDGSSPMSRLSLDNGSLEGELVVTRDVTPSGAFNYGFIRNMSDPGSSSSLTLSEANFLDYITIQ